MDIPRDAQLTGTRPRNDLHTRHRDPLRRRTPGRERRSPPGDYDNNGNNANQHHRQTPTRPHLDTPS